MFGIAPAHVGTHVAPGTGPETGQVARRLDGALGGRDELEQERQAPAGDGGVLPRGLPVGVAVKGLDGRWRAVLASDAAPVDFVQVMQFQDFSQLAAAAADGIPVVGAFLPR